MATKIKDSATAKNAALNLDSGVEVIERTGEPNAPREKTTSEKLFPDFTTEDGGIINRPVRASVEPLPASATPDLSIQGQTPVPQVPTVPVYLKPEDLIGKMARLKVDGVEQDVPAESLIKTNQLERHLNAQLMKVAQEAKALEDERRRFQTAQVPLEQPKVKQPDVKKTPETEAFEARIAQMQAEMQMLQQTMLPAIQESGIKRVEQMVKNQIGTDDFRSYFEKIKDSAMEQMAKPEIANDPNARRYFDSDAYYFEKYKEMKLREMVTKSNTPNPVNSIAPVLQTQTGAPVVVNNSGQPVSIPSFEGSGGVPSRQSPDVNWQGTYNALFQRARESGAQDDWLAFYRHKTTSRE